MTCGGLRGEDERRDVVLNGWVDVVRDLGGLLFIDLRDRYGVTQAVVDPDVVDAERLARARELRPEYVVALAGTVRRRPAENVNRERATGAVEVLVRDLEILNRSKTPPFEIRDDAQVSDEVRLRYRYLDLRRSSLRGALEKRNAFFLALRRALEREGYIEVETPLLTRMTPEGSREYVVPSRVHPGRYYALPQSPQVFKQLLMIGGLDRYFQIARCLRDEDLRADRQPEFTQLDLELSFGDEEDVFSIIESVLRDAIRDTFQREVAVPFRRMAYQEAMDRYGLDKPDLRFGLEIRELAGCLRGSGFRVVDEVLAAGGLVRGLVVEGGAERLSRKEIDGLTEFVAGFGAKGLAFLKADAAGALSGSLARFVDGERRARLRAECGFRDGDLLLVVADRPAVACRSLGELRNELARRLGLVPRDERLEFTWITEFPMCEWSDEEQRFVATHHPFTMFSEEEPGQLERGPGKVRARAYDLVLNGWELGSGSVRIHTREEQQRVFQLLGIAPDEAREKFGFFLEAFEYGAPPHAGIALGLERTLALLLGRGNIRDLVAFPKTASAKCLLTGAPTDVPEQVLRDLGLPCAAPQRGAEDCPARGGG
ncbi:MAG: aspartate--tRNA ligase [Planctomycetes bacterium]|nr:aspartate--tRNA ligase [Planctomycetota bacterium]